ncbi:hypothetical protein [Streptomyces sp. P9-A4]|uniref:hypothetical protein n=1 Tax=Streptomyces sp. P9-A4 TaxID=3072285 RepID=UPI002FCCA939
MADRVPVLTGWEDPAACEDRVGIHPGDPILLSPDHRIDEVLSRYLCRSSFARPAPETKRNYTDDYCLFFDFLWGRGKCWSEASADDLWDFEDWRIRSLRNASRIGGARWNRGLAALARLYEWAVQREFVQVNPLLMRSVVGRTGNPVLVPAARAKNARTSEVRWLMPRAFRRWVDVGLHGFGADGLPTAGWAGRLADRKAAFAGLLCCTGRTGTAWWAGHRCRTRRGPRPADSVPTQRRLRPRPGHHLHRRACGCSYTQVNGLMGTGPWQHLSEYVRTNPGPCPLAAPVTGLVKGTPWTARTRS